VVLPADVVEEVARIIGYDSLPETLPSGRAVEVWRDPNEELHGRVRRLLAAAGCSEAITYIATSADHLRLLGPSEASAGFLHAVEPERALTLRNPLQSDRATLRTTALAGLLETTAANLKHETGVRLFEIGRAYLPTTPNDLPNEANIATIVLAGRREPLSRFTGTGQMDYFDLKGIIDALLGALAIADVTYERTDHAALHPGRAAVICRGDRRLGLIGEVRPDRAAAFGIEGVRTVVAELDLDLVLDSLPASSETITVPKFLPVEQDFAVIVSTETPATAVEAAILAGAGSLASGIALFDVYEGEQIGAGRRSLAYRVTFTAPDRALTDDDLPKVRSRIERAVKQRVDGQLRA
jgi:phenylalanyl-tRNA synthetase beta chain